MTIQTVEKKKSGIIDLYVDTALFAAHDWYFCGMYKLVDFEAGISDVKRIKVWIEDAKGFTYEMTLTSNSRLTNYKFGQQ